MRIYQEVVASRLDQSTRAMLDRLRARENVSISIIVRQAIRLLFEQRGKLD